LLKDILSFSGIKHAGKIYSLLKLVAYQVGSEVSYNELSRNLGINKVTVENYLDLLTKVFILFKLPSFSNNPRKEISKSVKWYFYDNGIRNAIINDFRPIHMRNDIGQLWESYFIAERIKHQSYLSTRAQHYFWRNYHQQEVDLVEVFDGSVNAFEIKYNPNVKVKFTKSFTEKYPPKTTQVIHKENFWDYLL
jgi:predicted AAA+ superfamily ATPase